MFEALKMTQDEIDDSLKLYQDEIYETSEDCKVAKSM